MPFASRNDFNLPVPPTTRLPQSGDESWSMSYFSGKLPGGGMAGLGALGDDEQEVLSHLPRKLVEYLAEEAEDLAFVHDYLIPALHSRNPHAKIVNDIAKAAYEYSVAESGMGDLGKSFFKKIAKVVRKVHKAVTPKFMQKIEGKIHKVERKVWKKYGSVIISVAGGVLAPFTGGASLVAAAIIVAGKGLYEKRKAAIEAKKAARADAAQLEAQANAAEAQTSADVEKFYRENQAWFLQYDMTPDKWAKLTLQQKIDFINAGVAGTMPVTAQTVANPSQDYVAAQAVSTAQAAANAGIPQGAVAPPGAPPDQGYSTSAGGAPPPAGHIEGAPASGTFEAVLEGQSLGTFQSADEAYNAILANSQVGQRFEIIANGKSLGLAVRTQDGAVEVPPEAEAKMKALSPEQARAVVNEAEKEEAKSGGGFPWWLILAGGAAVAVAGGH